MPLSPDVYVLLNFGRASRLVRFQHDAEGRLFVNNLPTPLLPPFYRLAAQSKVRLVGYNFGTGSEVSINFQLERGAVKALTYPGGVAT